MDIAALVTWVLTALGGFAMLGMWISRGGHRADGHSKIAPGLVFGHLGLAAAGLVLWIIYVLTDAAVIGWIALVLLVPVAALGFTMLARWIPTYRTARATASAGAGGAGGGTGEAPPERAFPVPVVGAHGVFAVATVVLALLANLGVGS
jgi:manganese efflux pump family protein